MYKDVVDEMSQSYQKARSYFSHYVIRYNTLEELDLRSILKRLEPEYWLPLKVFPRFEYEKEGKMKYSFYEFKEIPEQLESFKTLVREYILGLKVQKLFIPPPDLVVKVSSSRYNDNGIVRRDYEKPQYSLDSGFLYQKFCPKPLEPREVWLPDYATKINNSYWMLIGRSLLTADPTYPSDDPTVTWEKIRSQLYWFGYFDISGFGLQYPRQYLKIIVDVITELYSSPDLEESRLIFHDLMDHVKVNMDNGKFVYPPRGIGLGYYEDLKTIGICALIKKYKPISVYGDQALLPFKELDNAIKTLRDYQFILKDEKIEQRKGAVRWSGWTMTPSSLSRPKQVFEPLISLFYAQYHWERKMILRSFWMDDPSNYNRYDKYIPFLYETLFGYEFTRGDSMWNFYNSGVSSLAPVETGFSKGWKVQQLVAPTDTITDEMIYETPFFTEWKRRDCKLFSILRKKTYRSSPVIDCSTLFYSRPIVSNNRTKKPTLSRLGRILSDSQECKLIVNHGQTSGKFTCGLNNEEMLRALLLNSWSRNPFECFSTGGYQVLTKWRSTPTVSKEWYEFYELLSSGIPRIGNYYNELFDTRNPSNEFFDTLFNRKVKRSFHHVIDESEPVSIDITGSNKIRKVTLDLISSMDISELRRDDSLRPATSILGDITNRSIIYAGEEEFSYLDEDIDESQYLEDEEL